MYVALDLYIYLYINRDIGFTWRVDYVGSGHIKNK